jgi:asparagine synthase (glutamine-hydrolysing)
MCGICGIWSADGIGPDDRALVRSMCDAMIHRGPEDEGTHFDDAVALGMRRLKIIDLVTGNQPIYNEDGTVAVVFNGEIYNFPSLREELLRKGHVFKTKTDTEVIVHLYEEEGDRFVRRLNGMFAIALRDKKAAKLVLVRDRLGIKPLHYLRHRNRIIFASEIKSLLRSDMARTIDPEAISQYFSFEYIPAPRSVFRGIEKLLPAHMLVIEKGGMKISSYWDVRYEAGAKAKEPDEAYEREIISRLRESVRMRLISDVPLGVFLSGGIDSSAVTALMCGAGPSKIKTYSIGFAEKSFDELPYAKRVADYFGTDHTEFTVDSTMVKELVPVLMRYLDEPLADASVIPTYIISRLARKYVTVALAGDGGDELFGGYDTYKAFRLARLYDKVPKFIRSGLVNRIVPHLPASEKRLSFEFKAKKFIVGADYPPEIANTIWWGAYPPPEKTMLLSDALRAAVSKDPFEPIRFHLGRNLPADPLDRICYLDLKLYLQDDLLVKVDRMSMANSLEIRVPFLDYAFVEYAAAIPSSLKLRGFKSKYILKKALSKHLPREILHRKKIGFDIPLGVWIRNELREFVRDVLAPENLKKHGYFNASYIQKILDEHMSGAHNHRQLLWPLIIFQHWYDEYIARI